MTAPVDVVDAGAGVVVYRRFECHFAAGESTPLRVDLGADFDQRVGRFVVTSLTATGVVTSNAIGRIAIARLLRNAPPRGIYGLCTGPGEMVFQESYLPNDELPRKLDDDAYRKIGLAYVLYRLFSWKPTHDLAVHYSVSKATARLWMKETARRGALDPVWESPEQNSGAVGVLPAASAA